MSRGQSSFRSHSGLTGGCRTAIAGLVMTLVCPSQAEAHGFGALYNLPVPLWLYNWTAATVLLVSFLMVVIAVRPAAPSAGAGIDVSAWVGVRLLRRLMPLLRAISVALLFLCMLTGFWGNPDPLRNFSPVFFWIVIALMLTYLVALWGDIYAAISPFRSLTDGLQYIWPGYCQGRYTYPKRWGQWPALLLYLGFIWFELFGQGTPRSIAVFLAGYTLLNVIGVGLIGARDWFAHCEFFSVFFRLIGYMAPLACRTDGAPGGVQLRLRKPLSGLLHERPQHLSSVVFVLAMLSTTAFDGLTATQWWVQLFWGDPTGLIESAVGTKPTHSISTLMPWYIAWESFWLFFSPFVYLLVYVAVLWLGKSLVRSQRGVRELAMDFAYTLLPIALAYHITHYWTLVLTHGLKVFSLISDPFGWRWDLFGTAMKFRAPIIPDMGVVWHSQIALIVVGHILGVYLAHKVALRVFPSRGASFASQLPMLLFMILLTVFGLWILAQPLTAVSMR